MWEGPRRPCLLSGATLTQTRTHKDLVNIISKTLYYTILYYTLLCDTITIINNVLEIIFTKSLWVWVCVSVTPLVFGVQGRGVWGCGFANNRLYQNYRYNLPRYMATNYYYQTPHPQTPHPWTPDHFFLLEVDYPASLLVLEPVARCSGGEGTPPETLNGLTCNPQSLPELPIILRSSSPPPAHAFLFATVSFHNFMFVFAA